MLADTRGIKINDKDKKELTEKILHHAASPPRFRRRCTSWRDAGFRLFTLTDNLLEVARRASSSMAALPACSSGDIQARTA